MSAHPLQALHRAGKLHAFRVTIQPVYIRRYCAEHHPTVSAMGYLFADRCPNCRLEDHGWAAWGCNGHQQGTGRDRDSLLHFLKVNAYRAWPATQTYGPGHYLRMTFRRGSRIVYQG